MTGTNNEDSITKTVSRGFNGGVTIRWIQECDDGYLVMTEQMASPRPPQKKEEEMVEYWMREADEVEGVDMAEWEEAREMCTDRR